MSRQQCPTAMGTNFAERAQNNRPAGAVHYIGPLFHLTFLDGHYGRGFREERTSGDIVPTVYRFRLVTMKPCSVTGKSDEVGKGNGRHIWESEPRP